MYLTKLVRPALVGLFACVFLLSAQAQNKTIAGKVTDSKDGSPLVGASVIGTTAKGVKVGVTTAASGTYSLSSAEEITKISITMTGYENMDINVSGRTTVDAAMKQAASNLSEVIVVGYGTQQKKEITSAITSISAEQFNKGNVNDVAQLLQGKAAGLSIARPGGDPNGGFEIRLRGLSTLGANAQPLVVVDGQVGADMNSIDPADIKSVDILKDGSSAAIYGTRGSAGVIIITTKTGAKGRSELNYSGSVSIESPARYTPHMSSTEYRAFIKTLGAGTDFGANTDWYDEVTRTAIAQQHNLSLSGGNDHTTYNVSMNYRRTEGIGLNTGFDQINGRAHIQHKAINDKLTLTADLSTTRRQSMLGFGNAYEYATIYNPTSPVYAQTPSQDLAGGGFFEVSATEYSNPVAILLQNMNDQTLKRLNFAISGEYEFTRGLKFLLRYAQQQTSTYLSAYTPSNAFIDRGFYNGVTGVGRHGYSYKNDDEATSQLFESTLSYAKRFNKIDMNVIAGYSYQDFLNQGYNAGGGNFITDLSGQSFATAQDFQNGLGSVNSYKNGSRLVAFFGRVNLNYNNKVYLSASYRREGSSQFGPNNKWGDFPAISAGADLSKFFDFGTSVSMLKLRASYGVTGALPPFPGLSQLTFTGQGNYLINGSWIATYGPNQNANPDLKWEKKAETDIGLDFGLFGGRLNGTLDYYVRNTTDLLFNVTVPSPPALFNRAWKNVGDLRSTGYEITLNYDVLRNSKSLTWTTGINYAHNHVVLTRLDPSAGSYIGETNLGSPGQEATQITRSFEGEEIGAFYQAVYRGVDKNGKFLHDDGKGNAVLSTATTYKTVIGHGLPDFEIGWTNTFRLKNWDFNFFLRGSFGHDLINTNRAFYENPTVAALYNVVKTKYFNPDLKDAQIFSSLYVEKGDFVKLDNATLGYNFNIRSKTGNGVKNLRVYLTGRNLFTITGYTGADPEVRYSDKFSITSQPNILAPGIDRRATWVLTRSFTFGLNLGL
jgi:TonB-linked SusC/RagA family outer membrane protein